ncbi:hypothetical protein BH23ACT9_BH23ACT9_14220 [soil metagenome]
MQQATLGHVSGQQDSDEHGAVLDALRIPVGRTGQLRALHAQLVRCEQAVHDARRQAVSAMRDPDLLDAQRWQAVQQLRALAWKVCREILPLVGRVPLPLQAEPDYTECQRIAHALRRATEAALRDNANYTVDLVAAAQAADDRTTRMLPQRTSVR